jgi:hypothetical protein
MGAILRVLVHCAMVLPGSCAIFGGFGELRYGFTRVGRNFEGFAMLLSIWWWDAGEVYASDLIYETSLWYGCRPQGLP